jgi:undecaprenyl-diphosphatase
MFFRKLLELDRDLTSRLRIKEPSKLKPFGAFFAHSGDSWFILLALFIIWLLTQGLWHHISALMAAASIALAVFVLAVKFLIKRRRPEGKWGAIYRNTDPHSFPSGHAARTAMLAFIAISIGPLWFGILLILWAPLVSLARVWMGVHYLSDVLAGFALGILAGILTLQLSPWLTSTFPFLF